MRTLFASVLLCSTMTLTADALAHQTLSFDTSAHSASPVSGQIDWPAGSIEQFDGKVIVLVPPIGPYDRDGWAPERGRDSKDRRPYLDIAEALVDRGYAVARFDNPGMLPAERSCHETERVRKGHDEVMTRVCTTMDKRRAVPGERYIASVGDVLATLRTIVPAAAGNTVLFAVGDSAVVATETVSRAPDQVAALISFGGGTYNKAVARHEAEKLAQANKPMLFLRGTLDRNRDVRNQLEHMKGEGKSDIALTVFTYKQRHRLLSRRGDGEWFEASFADAMADHVQDFLAALPPRD